MFESIQTDNNIMQFDDYIKSTEKAFRKVKTNIKELRSSFRITFSINIGSIDLNKYQKKKEIGSGAFGVVNLITNKETGVKYAAKTAINNTDDCEEKIILDMTREIYIISQLHHPSILQFIGYNLMSFTNESNPVIVTELASNGSLYDLLKKQKRGIVSHDWNDTKKLINIYGIASGMAYMHKYNILHRDLKTANILLDDYLFPKIADFGLSKILYHKDSIVDYINPISSIFCGTPLYAAPEILKNYLYTKAGDVFAFGLIAFEIITGQDLYHFRGCLIFIYIIKGKRPIFKVPVPYCFKKLIEKC